MATAIDPRLVELVAPEGDLTARFATHAGMVGCSLRHRGEELLGLGGGLPAYLNHGAVFGVPPDQPVICFEPMTAPVDALRSHEGLRSVPPGEQACATFALRVDQVSR